MNRTPRSLSRARQSRLAEQEAIIRRGMAEFIAVGQALLIVRDEKLWEAEYASFWDYCALRWDFGKQYVYHIWAGAEVHRNLAESSPDDSLLPASEGQTRPLQPLPPEQQRAAWDGAVAAADGRQPTATQVRDAADAVVERVLAGMTAQQQRDLVRQEEEAVSQRRRQRRQQEVRDARTGRLRQIRVLLGRLRRLTVGLGGEGDDILTDLDSADQKTARLEAC